MSHKNEHIKQIYINILLLTYLLRHRKAPNQIQITLYDILHLHVSFAFNGRIYHSELSK